MVPLAVSLMKAAPPVAKINQLLRATPARSLAVAMASIFEVASNVTPMGTPTIVGMVIPRR